MAHEHPAKVPGDEPFESETEIEDHSSEGGIFGHLFQPVWGQFCEDDLKGMIVRGSNFMSDKKKIDCGPALYKLMHADFFKTRQGEERKTHFAANKASWAYQRFERQQARANATSNGAAMPPVSAGAAATANLASDPLAPLIVINFIIPGTGGGYMNLVLYFARRVRTAEQLKKLGGQKRKAAGAGAQSQASDWEADDYPHDIARIAAFDGLLEKFLNGSDEFRDSRLKIVPRVAEGSWVVKKSIGRVPAILGKKVKQFYYRDAGARNYIEIDADLGTSMVAGRIISMVKGTAKNLVVDLSFLLQGEDKTELPESLLGGIRMIRCDLDKITYLDDNNEQNKPVFDF